MSVPAPKLPGGVHPTQNPERSPHTKRKPESQGVAATASSISEAPKRRPPKLLSTAHLSAPDTGAVEKAASESRIVPLTQEQKDKFHGIYKILAENTVFQLATKVLEINKLKNGLDDVHPLEFVRFVMHDEKMQFYLTSVKNKDCTWSLLPRPWQRTVDDFSEKMRTHNASKTLHTEEFLQHVPKADRDKIEYNITCFQYQQLLEWAMNYKKS